tara:strand:+ start:57 stop:686 length:630 start_codon:yes stop_codon:yes gene_type:complete
MPLPVLLVIVGQQVFRIAATAAAKRAAAAVGGRIVKEVPKALAKKTPKGQAAFTKLVKEKKPALQDRIGNLFTTKPNRVTQKSPGRTNKKEGINVGTVRQAASKRGDKVVGAASVAIPGAAVVSVALKKYRTDLAKERAAKRKANTETERAKSQTSIEKTLAKIALADEKLKTLKAQTKNAGPPKSRTSPSAPSKSLRPKMPSKPRPKK